MTGSGNKVENFGGGKVPAYRPLAESDAWLERDKFPKTRKSFWKLAWVKHHLLHAKLEQVARICGLSWWWYEWRTGRGVERSQELAGCGRFLRRIR